MKKIDLHIHSYYSDGEDSPESILEKVNENSIFLFSITDHNYISPKIIKLQYLAEKKNILILQGVEISSLDRETEKSLHILGYSKNFNIEKINNYLKSTTKEYNRRAKRITEKLNKKYPEFKLNFKKLMKKEKGKCISRNSIIRELIEFHKPEILPVEKAKKEAFIKENNLWMLSPSETIQLIKSSEGISVLAHPGKFLKQLPDFELLLKRLIDYGLVGLEVYSSKHSNRTIKDLKKLACKYNLLITAGSDWHGKNYTPYIKPGFEIPEKNYKKILIALKL